MAITIRKLGVFLEVAEHGSFRDAADQLGISQPSVSNQIAGLEAELGFTLFHRRSGARPLLTEQGHGFIRRAREMVSAHAGLLGEEAPSRRRKKLVVAAGAALFELLRPELPALILRYPEIDIEFEAVTQFHAILRAMDEKLIDIALYTGALPGATRDRIEIICPVSYSIFACPALAARHAEPEMRDQPLPLALPPKGGWSTEPIRAMLAEAGVNIENIVARSPFPGVILEMALSGDAAVVLPEDIVAPHVQSGRLVTVKSKIGSGHRYIMIGPKARCAAGARIVEHLKTMVLALQQRASDPDLSVVAPLPSANVPQEDPAGRRQAALAG